MSSKEWKNSSHNSPKYALMIYPTLIPIGEKLASTTTPVNYHSFSLSQTHGRRREKANQYLRIHLFDFELRVSLSLGALDSAGLDRPIEYLCKSIPKLSGERSQISHRLPLLQAIRYWEVQKHVQNGVFHWLIRLSLFGSALRCPKLTISGQPNIQD